MTKRTSGWLLALCLCVGVTAGAPVSLAGDEGEKKDDKKEAAKATKPRVISNADLEKYGKSAKPGRTRQVVKTTPTVPLPVEEEAAPLPPRTSLPAEDRLDEASLFELEERLIELQELLTYLRAKEAWIKNPFLPRPTPPPGETLLDPAMSGGLELQVTRTRIFAVDTRLGKVRALIQAGGSLTPVDQP